MNHFINAKAPLDAVEIRRQEKQVRDQILVLQWTFHLSLSYSVLPVEISGSLELGTEEHILNIFKDATFGQDSKVSKLSCIKNWEHVQPWLV